MSDLGERISSAGDDFKPSRNLPPLFTTEETAKYFQVSGRTLAAWRINGNGLKYKKLGRRVMYAADDISEFLDLKTKDKTIN